MLEKDNQTLYFEEDFTSTIILQPKIQDDLHEAIDLLR